MTIPLDRDLVDDLAALLTLCQTVVGKPDPQTPAGVLARETRRLRQQLQDAIADNAQPPDVSRRPFGPGIG